jgi:DNA replication protein DnaC
LLVTGATGVGKTWIACALAQHAARGGFNVLYARCSRLLEELRIAHGDGSFARRLAQLARIDLLVLDDRVGVRSTLITSQLEVKLWHTWLADPTVADAILDRLVHSAHRIARKGESLRGKSCKAGESA